MYTPLYIKTDNSLQHSLIKVSGLIEKALKLNLKSLTITDNNMYGAMDFYKQCKKNNIKPIIGLEIIVDDKKLVLYCMNYGGYKNLIKLSTIMSYEQISINDLEKYSDNLIMIVPYLSLQLYDKLKTIYKYIFISYKNYDEKTKLKYENILYMNEILYLDESQKEYIKYLDAIRENIQVELIDEIHNDNYLKVNDIDILNNEKIFDLCNLEIPFNQKLMPKYKNDEGLDSYSYLKKLCINGLKKHFGTTTTNVYKDRLKYELDIINNMGFCDYFLIVQDYVRYAKENNIIVGTGRGSAVGSLVSFTLGITDVDPIKYNLLFERFLNPERISMPDIDIDFEHEKREEIINYCINKYGDKKVAPIITFGTLGAKQALRDVGRSMNLNLELIDSFCKLFDSKLTMRQNYDSNPRIKDMINRKEELKKLFRIAINFEGLKRHTSIHAAGIIMSDIDLDEIIPLDKTHNFYITGYDMTYLEEIGLLKMDFLAIKYLTTIHNIIDMININHNLEINFDNIPLNDSKALEIFTNANTVGIFQFESDGMVNFLRKLRPTDMDDIFAAIALFRPGPMKNIPTYINRKNGKEKIDYYDSSLEQVLKSTYGIMIYQEQIMQIARIMADYTLGEADILRKAMSKKKKDLLMQEQEKFISRSLKKGYELKLVEKVYNLMLKFAEYGFNKSHSVGYSIVAYKMAYLKAYFPKEFITNLLSMEVNNEVKIKQYIYEAKKFGIDILKPDINLSDRNYKVENRGIRYPLSNIKNVGINAVEVILKERQNGNFKDIYDFIKRCYSKSLNKKVLESLIYAGVFEEFNYNKKTLINNLDLIINYGDLIKEVDEMFAIKPDIIEYEEYSTKELMNFELNVFGFYLSKHPVTEVKLKYSNIVNLNQIIGYFDKNISTIIYIDKMKEVITKSNTKMCFITGSDEISQADFIIFPNIYEKYKDLQIHSIVKVNGKVEKRFDKYQIIVNSIELIKE